MAKRIDRLGDALYRELLKCAAVRNWPGTTHKEVPIVEVRRCFGEVYQRREGDDGVTAMIRASLSVLVERQLVAPVKATDLERIDLPTKVKLVPTAAKTPKIVPPMPRWHRLLYDLEDFWPTVTDKQRVRYVAINRWLLSNPDTATIVPLRERALEIFSLFGAEEDFESPEKALDGMRTGPLFGDQERLLHLLRAVATPPPLLSRQLLEEVTPSHLTRVGEGDLLLVVENSATWWSIVKALPALHNLGHIAWGLGASFISSIRSIADNHEIRRIRYFGDLDLSGLRIPDSARRTASVEGLPSVRPAVNLYAELFALGRSWRANDKAVDRARARELVGWLPAEHHDAAVRLLTEGRRIAQEWVGYRHLGQTSKWHADLM
ncbi:Wadjet anti-phage system protein JetD domain-containing protein [Actinosynnema sp. NPDC047251]|uniref:Wadjet protein JetD C-terminal domain-containing protein n=1 Tax=Saccharothrix espanaensis (strain ATCC 51144 / DSM 44229 / JCM 9112 / NBRC 15066 / NRRL 15764) TaxID=1179773 RepID=K0JQ39_SACES|nr:Wadjet anti-phage system protein JetD domain-containing protein [Saccharothrix espanaensis]CCH29400.1 hypothetical protein BN6_20800 [Saccharothrix espanaensis DSM 44229]